MIKKVVVAHLHYLEVWADLARSISTIDPDDLYVTTTDINNARKMVLDDFPGAVIYELDNRGRDIYPLIYLSKLGIFDEKSIVWKLHSKRSLHTLRGDKWRNELVDAIASDTKRVEAITSKIEIGVASIFGSKKYLTRLNQDNFIEHRDVFQRWCTEVGVEIKSKEIDYIAGTIFACDSQILAQLSKISLESKDFKLETNNLLFSRWFATKLYIFNYLSGIPAFKRMRNTLDSKTRPATQETYAFEAFFGILAQNFNGTSGIDE
jgi:lipopolysaccharide biosynthesis protein